MKRDFVKIFLAAVMSCETAYSQNEQIIGPPGGRVSALAINPVNPSWVYAGTNAGAIFRSMDQGQSTDLISPEGAFSNITQIVINPLVPNIIYTGIYRSSDAGATWQMMSAGGEYYAINPSNPKNIFVTRFLNEVWVTRDGGDSWEKLSALAYSNGPLVVAPSDTNVLYILGDGGVNKSTDAGKSWTKVTAALGDMLPLAITIDPRNAGIVYFGTTAEGIFKSIDGGLTWQHVLPIGRVRGIAINPVEPAVVYVITGDYLNGYVGSVYKTTDGGASWAMMNSGLPDSNHRYLYAIAINPQKPDDLYVGTYGWGVYRTKNGGKNWEGTNLSQASVLEIYVDPDSSGHLYAGTMDQGIMKTSDEGASWQALDFGVSTMTQSFFREFMFAPTNRNIAYATGGPYGLFKSMDGGNSWELTSLRGSFDTWIWSIGLQPDSPDTVYVGQTGFLARDLYRSVDGGITWQNLQATNGEAGVQDIVSDIEKPSTVFIAAQGKGVLKSTNSGVSWYEMNEGIRVSDPGPSPSRNAVLSLAMRTDSTNILWAVQRAAGTKKGGVYTTTNGGLNWIAVDSTLELLDHNLSGRDVLINPFEPKRVYVALGFHGQYGTSTFSTGGVFTTLDNGKTWLRLFGAANAIAASSNNRREIYLGTDYGIVKLVDTSATHVEQHLGAEAIGYELYQNYPNPFVASTQFEYSTPKQTVVKLTIYDLLGRVVITFFNESKRAGIYEISWDGKNSDGDEVLPGVYFYRLEAERFTRTKKMFLVR